MSAITSFVERVETNHPRMRMRTRDRSEVVTKSKGHLLAIEVAVDDANRRAVSGDWEGAKGATFVGLYALCHRMIYGVTPGELHVQAGFNAAAKLARKALHELFHDDPFEMANFVRWAWEVEKRKAAWAQSKAIDRKRLSYFYQFSRSLETDYRIERAKKGRR